MPTYILKLRLAGHYANITDRRSITFSGALAAYDDDERLRTGTLCSLFSGSIVGSRRVLDISSPMKLDNSWRTSVACSALRSCLLV